MHIRLRNIESIYPSWGGPVLQRRYFHAMTAVTHWPVLRGFRYYAWHRLLVARGYDVPQRYSIAWNAAYIVRIGLPWLLYNEHPFARY